MVAQPVTYIIESDGVGELGVEQRHDVTPGAEAPVLLVYTIFFSEISNHPNRDELA